MDQRKSTSDEKKKDNIKSTSDEKKHQSKKLPQTNTKNESSTPKNNTLLGWEPYIATMIKNKLQSSLKHEIQQSLENIEKFIIYNKDQFIIARDMINAGIGKMILLKLKKNDWNSAIQQQAMTDLFLLLAYSAQFRKSIKPADNGWLLRKWLTATNEFNKDTDWKSIKNIAGCMTTLVQDKSLNDINGIQWLKQKLQVAIKRNWEEYHKFYKNNSKHQMKSAAAGKSIRNNHQLFSIVLARLIYELTEDLKLKKQNDTIYDNLNLLWQIIIVNDIHLTKINELFFKQLNQKIKHLDLKQKNTLLCKVLKIFSTKPGSKNITNDKKCKIIEYLLNIEPKYYATLQLNTFEQLFITTPKKMNWNDNSSLTPTYCLLLLKFIDNINLQQQLIVNNIFAKWIIDLIKYGNNYTAIYAVEYMQQTNAFVKSGARAAAVEVAARIDSKVIYTALANTARN